MHSITDFNAPPARAPDGVLAEARRRVLQTRLDEAVLTDDELARLWHALQAHTRDDRLTYDAYVAVRASCAEQFGSAKSALLSAAAFLQLAHDGAGTVSARGLFDFVMRKVTWQQVRVHVRFHDTHGDGLLREPALASFLDEVIPSLAGLQGLPASFAPHYKRVALRRFTFFLDPRRRGHVRVHDLLASPFIGSLLELQEPSPPAHNWFTLRNALSVYKSFLELDVEKSGALTPPQFARFGDGLTSLFAERVFEAHVLGRRKERPAEMDFDAFLDFVLAWTHRSHPVALSYFYRVLDVHAGSGLTRAELALFFGSVHEEWLATSPAYDVPVSDVVSEIMDLLRGDGAEASRVSLRDFTRCGNGGTVVGLLASVEEFVTYDGREQALFVQAESGSPPRG